MQKLGVSFRYRFDNAMFTHQRNDRSVYRTTANHFLQINTIRVYNLDPAADHDECVSIFNAVGMYMVLDVNSPLKTDSLDRYNPSGSYTLSYLKRTFAIVEAFKDYPNTLAFFAANEVINDVATAKSNPPYIRVRASCHPYSSIETVQSSLQLGEEILTRARPFRET